MQKGRQCLTAAPQACRVRLNFLRDALLGEAAVRLPKSYRSTPCHNCMSATLLLMPSLLLHWAQNEPLMSQLLGFAPLVCRFCFYFCPLCNGRSVNGVRKGGQGEGEAGR